ncbi:class I SAM-dependent methyltransferase [Synechococcus sp. Cruz CV-v-12]|uniref:class I SAM-dependent methyltransferase n=2 Tax=unclassified Synechococcus TaxID=2626047 RepID=UPI0028F41367|nr:class I SAM-dependent methyltransferase [Synechococcus sp. Cruz CV-v-12]
MNLTLRVLIDFIAPETPLYGPTWGVTKNLIRSPVPHDPMMLWNGLQTKLPPMLDWLRNHYPPYPVRKFLIEQSLRRPHSEGIAHHYDVSNEFYQLFLDKKFMFYSCADFDHEADTLEQAQTNKANFLLGLIDPQPGERILDLGCGWGGMLQHIYESTGDSDNILGYTLSNDQFEYANQRLPFRVELENFITKDYEPESFDKIYSIGAWEHVRPKDVPDVLSKLYTALSPGGRLVQHFFCSLVDGYHTWQLAGQFYFPGSHPPAYPSQVRAFEAAGFRISARSIHDYRPTLRAWFDNLSANQDRAIELVGLRTYHRYLVFFASAWRLFDESKAMLVRYRLDKPV